MGTELTEREKQAECDKHAERPESARHAERPESEGRAESAERPENARPNRGKPFTRARNIVFALVVVVTCLGLAANTGTGTPSAWGWDFVSVACPIGALETMLANHSTTLRLLISFAAAIIAVLLMGKAFCAWACPFPHLQKLFQPKKQREADAERRAAVATGIAEDEKAGRLEATGSIAAANECYDAPRQSRNTAHRRRIIDSRHLVLGGVAISSFAFGFPVFCLVCPVGLTFGTLILLWRLVQLNQWSWGIILFPLIIVVEAVLLPRWCHTICPIGALMSLLARGNKTLRPKANAQVCLRQSGHEACTACVRACPEHIDLVSDLGEAGVNECIKCGRCVEACPCAAISFIRKSKELQK